MMFHFFKVKKNERENPQNNLLKTVESLLVDSFNNYKKIIFKFQKKNWDSTLQVRSKRIK